MEGKKKLRTKTDELKMNKRQNKRKWPKKEIKERKKERNERQKFINA